MSDDSIGLNTARLINPLEPVIRIQPGSFQLSLFDRSDEPTQWSFLQGSSVILTTEQLIAAKLKNPWLAFDMSLGPHTLTGLVGYLNGASAYHMQVLLPLIDT